MTPMTPMMPMTMPMSMTPMAALRRSITVHAGVPPMGQEESAEAAQKSPGSLADSYEGSGESRAAGTQQLSPTSSFNMGGSALSLEAQEAIAALAQITSGSVLCVNAEGWGSAAAAGGPLQLGIAVERFASKIDALANSLHLIRARSLASSTLIVCGQTEGEDPAVQLFAFAKELLQALDSDETLSAEEGLTVRLGMHSGGMTIRADLARQAGEGPHVFGEAAELATLLAAHAPASGLHVSQTTREKLGKEAEWAVLGQVEGAKAGEAASTSYVARPVAAKGGRAGPSAAQRDRKSVV